MSTPPPTFENYPPAWDAGVHSADGTGAGEPPADQSGPAVFVPPSAPPPPPPAPDRRTMLRLMVGGGAAVLAGIAVITTLESRNRPGFPGDAESQPADPDDESVTLPDNEEELGGYTVGWPDGWTMDGRTDTQLVLVQGGATVVFRAYTAGDDVTATEEAQRLLNRHTAGLGKRRTGAAHKGSGPLETASIEASGVRGDGVRVDTTVHVAIDPDDDREALAVIALLPSGTPAARRDEITQMRDDFLDQLG